MQITFQVAAWLAWRQKNKPSKPSILNPISRPPQAFANLLLNTNTTGNAGQQQQQQQLPVPQQQVSYTSVSYFSENLGNHGEYAIACNDLTSFFSIPQQQQQTQFIRATQSAPGTPAKLTHGMFLEW